MSTLTYLTSDSEKLRDFIHTMIIQSETGDNSDDGLHPVIKEFGKLIERDTHICDCFTRMFDQFAVENNQTNRRQVQDWKTMLRLFDAIITESPRYGQHGTLSGTPLNAVLDLVMNTRAGMDAFTHPKVNEHFSKVLKVWSEFLESPASRSVLTNKPDGWFCPEALKLMPNFDEFFVSDPNKEYPGFVSWDAFFTRSFRDVVRPVYPDDDNFISNACESTVYRKAFGVKKRDTFWLKGQPYSLVNMLDNDTFTPLFVGGTVYQAFLSPFNYHRWHSPVNGKVVKTVSVPGTYYAAIPDEGDVDVICRSQSFLHYRHRHSRITVGMAEISSCEITVKPGDAVKKGDQIGMFHYGGSTYCLVLRPETKVVFTETADDGKMVELNLGIAYVAN
ncbi:hypothetical protein SERLA73DRAFT_76929 [Serpula lacrymans var. lacrymans S7.3]|uniref:L-tryptophan decarboxylase PsiD-like domain-containing protein n=1 Tax=Serpula lacrymans var. lacrymans (strain S7.3) TaxID=936435 RepID=F8Q8J0_SERL3|nr:hypothetical protein SERLA73DRAFT_76929 [Serpula lacrymans var. lacrymans S7.3]